MLNSSIASVEVKPRFLAEVKPSFRLLATDSRETLVEDLNSVGGRLRAALKAAGMRQREVAAHFNVSEQAVSQWFRNETEPDRSKMFAVARLLRVRPEWIANGALPREAAEEPTQKLHVSGEEPVTGHEINIQQFPRDLPILGSASCGEDGLFEFNGQALDHARRPPRLKNVQGAYALYVAGTSMSPWREPGQLVFVHPHQPVKVGDYVVVQLHPERPGEVPHAYIKMLVRRTAKDLKLLQYSPREEKIVPMAQVKAIHRIMDWSELLGL